jgi:hypothetical protein
MIVYSNTVICLQTARGEVNDLGSSTQRWVMIDELLNVDPIYEVFLSVEAFELSSAELLV